MTVEAWDWTIGLAVAPFGRFGEIKVKGETDFPDRFKRLKQVCLRTPGTATIFTVESVRPHKGQMLLKLEGIGSIDDVERWRGARIQIPRADAVPLPEDSYYSVDLVGMEVVTPEGRPLGILEEVLKYPAQDLLKIGEILIRSRSLS